MCKLSSQIPDIFVWDDEEYVFLCADRVYSLFDPGTFGLHPSSSNSACWKGFVVYFALDRDRLYISKLAVNCDDGNYPVINGVRAYFDDYDGFYVYNNLNMLSTYTGRITLGKELLPQYMFRAFTGPHSYENTYELYFVDGQLVSWEESTGEYSWYDWLK